MRRTMNGRICGIFALRGQVERPAGIDVGQRLGGVPVHQRQVVVGGVLARGRASSGSDVPALLERQPLQRRGQVQPHDRRRIALAPARRASVEQLGDGLPLLERELDRPGADVRRLCRPAPSAIALVGQARR